MTLPKSIRSLPLMIITMVIMSRVSVFSMVSFRTRVTSAVSRIGWTPGVSAVGPVNFSRHHIYTALKLRSKGKNIDRIL